MDKKEFSYQKTGFLPDITEKDSVKASVRRKELKKASRCPAESEKTQSTTVNAQEVPQSRCRLLQNICVSMLQEGFHLSFKEVFYLLQRWKADRLTAGPDSTLWMKRSLEEQPLKLQMLKEHLTLAEAAQRADQYEAVYESYLALAKFFSEPDDMWLRQHFYELSLQASRKVKVDSRRREAEANAHLGRLYLERGELEPAHEHFKVFHHLATGQSWKDENGGTHSSRACESLCRVYTLLAQRQAQSREYQEEVQLLKQAYEIAKDGNKKMEGEAAYRVGLAYQRMGNQTSAKQFLNVFLETSTTLGDTENLGKAYIAIAECLKSEGKLSDAIEHLEKCLQVSQESNQDENLQDAYMGLGSIYISRDEYEQGCENFTMAFEVACRLNSKPCVEKAQVYLGIARANAMLWASSKQLQNSSSPNICTLIAQDETAERRCESAEYVHFS